MFEFLKKNQVTKSHDSMCDNLNRIMDNLIFNDKCRNNSYNENWYNDGVVKFRCYQDYHSGVVIYDATDCQYGILVKFYQIAPTEWFVQSPTCRQKLIDRLNGIIEMAEQLPSRESEFCKRL